MCNFMSLAIKEAAKADGEIPVGAVIVKDNKVISFAFNEKEKNNDVTAHAEIIAIKKAAQILGNWRLENCELYVTLEPCPMCGWAIVQSRLKSVYFGSYDANYGALGSKMDLRKLLNSKLQVYGGIMEEECNKILKEYFEALR